MKTVINYKNLTITLVAFTIAAGTLLGFVQEYIPFQDPLNELVFCGIALMAGILGLFGTFETPKKQENE